GTRTPNPLIKRWNGLSAMLACGFAGRREAHPQESDAVKTINRDLRLWCDSHRPDARTTPVLGEAGQVVSSRAYPPPCGSLVTSAGGCCSSSCSDLGVS